jgi:predicted DNA-binding protein (MmcQ/YjbR family)
MTNEMLRELCLAFPSAAETVKWDHLCFTLGEKIFCISAIEDGGGVSFKVNEEDFESLTEREGFTQAPHFARRQWVSVLPQGRLSKTEWQDYLSKSYERVKSGLPKKVQAAL